MAVVERGNKAVQFSREDVFGSLSEVVAGKPESFDELDIYYLGS